MKALLTLTTALVAAIALPAMAADKPTAMSPTTATSSGAKVWIGKDGTVIVESKDGKTLLMMEAKGDAMLMAPDGRVVDVDSGKASLYEAGSAPEETKEILSQLETIKKDANR